MPLSKQPGASNPRSGPLDNSGQTKSQRLLMRTLPGVPEFPLSEEVQADLASRPGEMPRNLNHWSVLLAADGSRQRRGNK